MPYTPNYAAGDVLTAAAMNSIGEAWSTFGTTANFKQTGTTPALNLGSGATWFCVYSQINKTVTVRGRITWGSTGLNAGNGAYRMDLPVTAKDTSSVSLGVARFVDFGSLVYPGQIALASTTQAAFWYSEINGTLSLSTVTELGASNRPFTFGNADWIEYTLTYEAA